VKEEIQRVAEGFKEVSSKLVGDIKMAVLETAETTWGQTMGRIMLLTWR